MRAVNCTRNQVLVETGRWASSRWTRLRGLLGHSLGAGEGLLLLGTKAIHTFGMRVPVDVLFLDARGRVIHLIHALPPCRASPFIKGAAMALELRAGTLRTSETQVGDSIFIVLCGDV